MSKDTKSIVAYDESFAKLDIRAKIGGQTFLIFDEQWQSHLSIVY